MHETTDAMAVPWTQRDVGWGLAAFGVWLAGFVGFAFWIRARAWQVDLGLLVSGGEALLVLPAWWLSVRKYGLGWSALGLRPFQAAALGMGCALMLGSFLFNFVYGLFLGLFHLQMQMDLTPVFAELSEPWLLLVGGAVVAPVAEEIFFRGFVFGGLRPRYGWRKAAVVSAALFALLHLTPTAILPIFLLGLIFAYLYQMSGSLWPSILMHMLTNGIALGAAYLASQMNLPGF
ncbi:MAG: CPBP family intramembrane metalloprotease [Caldilineae bacterium]|nr:MAG: CPBP family intramembrane metalloprotease [Caldilineae bacterium]